MRLPIRVRLTLISGALMGVVLLALGAFVYLRLEAELAATVDAGLRARAEVAIGDRGVLLQPPGSRVADPEEAFAQLISWDGRVLGSTPGLPAAPLVEPGAVASLDAPRYFDREMQTVEEVVPVRLLALPAADGTILLVGASLEDQHEALARLLALLLIAVPVAIAVATGVGWLLAGAALRPVERLRAEADAVSSAEPGRRLPVPTTGDELTRLARSLNRMLERLEEALARERRFVGDASHELRTPLANLQAELELALRQARTEDELTAALRSAAEETDRLARLAADLLVLARADGGRLRVRRESIDVAGLLRDEVATFAGRASAAGVGLELRVDGALDADVDPTRIRQAIGNLIDNALRHTPAGGRIRIDGRASDDELEIEVADSGHGFEPGFAERAFDPFTRAEEARTREGGGSGLGLAIARAVVEAHGGRAEARNLTKGGASVALHLPR